MRRFRPRKPEPRTIVVKYAGKCAGCGAEIKVGETAEYFPPGYLGLTQGEIRHVRGSWDEGERVSMTCYANIKKRMDEEAEARAVNDYAGDGLDERVEDDYARRCGLV